MLRVLFLIPDTASRHRNTHCNLNSKSHCNCFCNSHCICSESATATITAPSPETVAESVAAEKKLMIQYRYRKCAGTDTAAGTVAVPVRFLIPDIVPGQWNYEW